MLIFIAYKHMRSTSMCWQDIKFLGWLSQSIWRKFSICLIEY